MVILPLQAHHAAAYRDLMLQAYERDADAFTSTAAERAAEPIAWWEKRIADPKGQQVAFGAFDGDTLLGSVALEFSLKPKTRHKGLVIGMVVQPQARGAGLGKALLHAALQHADAVNGVAVLTLTVTQGNAPALKLYDSAGFQTFGTEPMAILTPQGLKAKVHMWRATRKP
jgi:ribosomal protein S18 acetylase RimI-like enzyme